MDKSIPKIFFWIIILGGAALAYGIEGLQWLLYPSYYIDHYGFEKLLGVKHFANPEYFTLKLIFAIFLCLCGASLVFFGIKSIFAYSHWIESEPQRQRLYAVIDGFKSMLEGKGQPSGLRRSFTGLDPKSYNRIRSELARETGIEKEWIDKLKENDQRTWQRLERAIAQGMDASQINAYLQPMQGRDFEA